MDFLIVRHGESEGNHQGRMQGHLDFSLSDVGRAQAVTLGKWLVEHQITWDVAYSSPLARAYETAEILARDVQAPIATPRRELMEIGAGLLEGLTRQEMAQRHPRFLERSLTELADFSDFGGESYAEVQARAERFLTDVEAAHREAGARILVVGHGGINFQLLKRLICEPVPRVCIVRMTNCAMTHVRMRERRGRFIGELVWHIPLELMGGTAGEGSSSVFR